MAITAPVVGSSGKTDVQFGANVWRPGNTPTQGTTVQALYQLNNAQVYALIDSSLKDKKTKTAFKSAMVEAGYLAKKDFQSAYWSSDDTAAFLELLKKSNADGVTFQERLNADLESYSNGGSGGIGSTQTQKSTNISDPKTARAIVQSSMRALLGRDATDAEYATLTKALGKAEAASPSVSTTTRTGSTSYSTMTTGGLDAAGKQMAIEEQIKATPGLETELVNKRINSYGDVIAKLAGI